MFAIVVLVGCVSVRNTQLAHTHTHTRTHTLTHRRRVTRLRSRSTTRQRLGTLQPRQRPSSAMLLRNCIAMVTTSLVSRYVYVQTHSHVTGIGWEDDGRGWEGKWNTTLTPSHPHPHTQDEHSDTFLVANGYPGIKIFREREAVHHFQWPNIVKISYKRRKFRVKYHPVDSNGVVSALGLCY